MNPMIARKRANTQNAGAKTETKLKMEQRNPQTNSGYFLPNLSDMVLTQMLPIKNPRKITEVETNPNEPRSQTRSNYGRRCKSLKHFYVNCYGINGKHCLSPRAGYRALCHEQKLTPHKAKRNGEGPGTKHEIRFACRLLSWSLIFARVP